MFLIYSFMINFTDIFILWQARVQGSFPGSLWWKFWGTEENVGCRLGFGDASSPGARMVLEPHSKRHLEDTITYNVKIS